MNSRPLVLPNVLLDVIQQGVLLVLHRLDLFLVDLDLDSQLREHPLLLHIRI